MCTLSRSVWKGESTSKFRRFASDGLVGSKRSPEMNSTGGWVPLNTVGGVDDALNVVFGNRPPKYTGATSSGVICTIERRFWFHCDFAYLNQPSKLSPMLNSSWPSR